MNLKKIFFPVILICIISLSVWKWKIWFGEIVEEKFQTEAHLIDRVMLSLGENVASERNLAWRCDTMVRKHVVTLIKENSEDTIYIESKGTLVETQGGKSVFYRAEITQLESGKEYRYSIKNSNYVTPFYTFKMGDNSSSYSFVYIGDIQDKKLEDNKGVLKNIITNNKDADFIAFGGDMIERPTEKYWNIWYQSLNQMQCNIPFIACAGNHEYHKGIIKKIDKRWTHYFPQPHNGPENFKGRCCYWNYKNTLFVVLDTDGICEPFALQEQYSWAKEVLKKSDAKWKIVIMHHPVRSLRSQRINPVCCYLYKPLFEDFGVDLVLQGHDHGYSRLTEKDDLGNPKTPVYIVSSCSPKYYTPSVFDEWDSMAAFRKMYQVINVSPDTLTYKCYDIEKGLYDDLTIAFKDKVITQNKTEKPELLAPSDRLIKKGGSNLKDYLDNVEERKNNLHN